MRNTKFRGKKIDEGQLFTDWVVGDLCKFINGSPCICPRTYFATRDFGDEDDDEGLPKLEEGFAIGEFFSVCPESVGQFTGFYDKKGTEIYEGDIVNGGLGLIVWCEETSCFRVKWYHETWKTLRSSSDNYRKNGEPLYMNSQIVWEVIGNKFDNPELIKDEN